MFMAVFEGLFLECNHFQNELDYGNPTRMEWNGTTTRMEWNGTPDRTSVDTHLGSGQEPLSLSSLTNFRSTSSHLWRRAFSASWEVVSGERGEERGKRERERRKGERKERKGERKGKGKREGEGERGRKGGGEGEGEGKARGKRGGEGEGKERERRGKERGKRRK